MLILTIYKSSASTEHKFTNALFPSAEHKKEFKNKWVYQKLFTYETLCKIGKLPFCTHPPLVLNVLVAGESHTSRDTRIRESHKPTALP